jgi:hypothetical protein
VIAYDLRIPGAIYVGCESKGFFKSVDEGKTWKNIKLVGVRITSVVLWPWEKFYPSIAKGRTHLCVTTAPDQWMIPLGRGKPAVSVKEMRSRAYRSGGDDVSSLQVLEDRTDTGFYNVAWDKSLLSTTALSFATTHGYQGNSGGHMSLFPPEKRLEWFRPLTALGTSARGTNRSGRFFTQALDPVEGRLSYCEGGWGMGWNWRKVKGTPPKGGLIHAAGDPHTGDQWWFVYTDGLYHSADAGKTLSKIMDASGKEVVK